MDADEIRTLLGDNIFERAKKYRKRIQQSTCTVNADGVRHISAMVQGSGGSYYYTQAWLRENGSFVSASCSCPYNQNGEGTYCKHIGALLLDDAEKNAPAPAAKPDAIPGVVRGAAGPGAAAARRWASRRPRPAGSGSAPAADAKDVVVPSRPRPGPSSAHDAPRACLRFPYGRESGGRVNEALIRPRLRRREPGSSSGRGFSGCARRSRARRCACRPPPRLRRPWCGYGTRPGSGR